MKRFKTSILTVLILISSLTVSASANFSDVKQADWYYETVTEMTEKGLFNGKGNNLFCPNDTMTKAEFLAVTMRIICPDANLKAENTLAWWQPAYNLAKQAEIIDEVIFPVDSMENVITRQEMAYISSMAFFEQKDGNPDDKEYKDTVLMATQVSLSAHNSQKYGFDLKNSIPDYDEIGNDYKGFAVIAYLTGLLGGVDDTGRFAPKDTLTRAEGATVLYRIVRKDKRLDNFTVKDDEQTNTGETVDLSQPITIHEGQERTNRLAKEGDIVIKADGTQVVLKKGPHGVLGEGQGVAPDLGLRYCPEGDNPSTVADGKMFTGGRIGDWRNSLGKTVVGDFYYVHPLTGEGHWGIHWDVIASASYNYMLNNGIEGKNDGEISADKHLIWSSESNDWEYIFCNPHYVK